MTRLRQTRAARATAAAAGASLFAYELPALAFFSPRLRRRRGIVDRIAGDRVALTFDDGPHHSGTPAVLAALAAESVSPDSIVLNLCRDLAAGDVMLLHDADHYSAAGSWRKTAAALSRLIETLRRRSLEPVPLPASGARTP